MSSTHSARETVFIVDDDASIGEGLSNLLESIDLNAEHYSSAEDFLAHWSSDRAGCLVLDVRLPGMTGVEFQEKMRLTGIDIPIIFMTAHGDIPMVRKVMKDFPEVHQNSIVQRSVDYSRCPENHRTSVRCDMRMNGMIVEDDTSLRGTRISWLLQVDLKGCLPSSMLNHLFAKYQADFITALIKACH